MNDSSIDDLLAQLRLEGKVESLGRFTLSGEKLRLKLGAFQFERPSQWVLKVIQALELAKVESCKILNSHQRTSFVIQSSGSLFPLVELENRFLNPETEASPVVGHFVTALWCLSFNLKLAWVWKPRSSKVGLIWTGSDLRTIEIGRFIVSMLEVSHVERKSEGKWWSQGASVAPQEGPASCAEMAIELTRSAYTCPFPLRFDGLRIDNLLQCSSLEKIENDDSKLICLSSLGWGKADAAAVQLPPGTLVSLEKGTYVEKVVSREPVTDIAWMALLMANLRSAGILKLDGWRPRSVPSRVTWIRHGVVVGERMLKTSSGASCHLFVSADDLKVDVSGLKLIWADESLKGSVRAAVLEWLKGQSISFSPRHHSRLTRNKFVSNMIGFGAVIAAVAYGVTMPPLLAAGAAVALRVYVPADDSQDLERQFQEELLTLCEQWT